MLFDINEFNKIIMYILIHSILYLIIINIILLTVLGYGATHILGYLVVSECGNLW